MLRIIFKSLSQGMFNAVGAVILIGCLLPAMSRAVEPAVTLVDRSPTGLAVHFVGGGLVDVQVWSDRIVHVRYTASGRLPVTQSLAVIAKPDVVKCDPSDTDEVVGIRTAAVEVRVDRKNGAVSFIDAVTHRTFLAETADGRGTTSRDIGPNNIHGPSQAFVLGDGEAIYGLGQHQQGVMDYVGHAIHLQQMNTEIAVPVLTSTAGYTLLWDNPSITDIDVGKADPRVVRWSSEAGDSTDYYVCYGPDLDTAIGGYRSLTGAAPMLGRWAWGFWQSRERYESQAEILEVAADYRRRNIPLDGVVQDWQYWGAQPWGSHAFSSDFPDPAALMRTLHDEHVHAIISVWAKFDRGSSNHDELERAGLLYPTVYKNVYPPGWAQWYDAFNPAGRDMYWRQISQEIGKYGWDGYWLDATEPELGGRWGEIRDLNTAAGPGYSVANAYPLETTTAVYQGQRKDRPAERAFILTRSAYTGQQRNGALSWSGDIAGNWAVFKNQIPAGLNFVASGIPYWNTDTGGFFGGDHADFAYHELFVRWFQFSAFCPMFRVHGTGSHKEQWLFGDETAEVLLAYDQLRYRLLPYIYALSWDVTHEGGTMMRPLAFDFRTDPAVAKVADQFMFGPALMVCPVTEPVGNSFAVIPSTALIDRDGVPGGLSADYFQGENFEKPMLQRKDTAVDFNWDKIKREGVGANPRTDPIPGLEMDHFSARWVGSIQTDQAGPYKFRLRADDGMRLWVNDKLVIDDWHARAVATALTTVDLPAHTRVPIKVEYFQNLHDALIELRWQPPIQATKTFTRRVYLPAGTWFDFWTGDRLVGGKVIDAPAPIQTLPMFVRAGSILPMGVNVQYAGEQPDCPLELRVYRGANGMFTLYDDAGDGYGYEHGERATIQLTWDDHSRTLTVGARSGQYPGMPNHRRFNIVWVDLGHGTGGTITTADQIIEYNGATVTVQPPPG